MKGLSPSCSPWKRSPWKRSPQSHWNLHQVQVHSVLLRQQLSVTQHPQKSPCYKKNSVSVGSTTWSVIVCRPGLTGLLPFPAPLLLTPTLSPTPSGYFGGRCVVFASHDSAPVVRREGRVLVSGRGAAWLPRTSWLGTRRGCQVWSDASVREYVIAHFSACCSDTGRISVSSRRCATALAADAGRCA